MMSALSIQPAYQIFTDADGQPLDGGYVWIGKADLDPQEHPIALYWDVNLTIPASQPIRTINGYLSNAGTPGRVYAAESSYSMRVQDKNGRQVYSSPSATGFALGTVVPAGQTVTLHVPASYADVKDAFDAIRSWVILGTVEIKIADGVYNWTRNQNCNHTYGNNIRVIGNQSNPNNVVIRGPVNPTFDMFSVSAGHTLGLIDGISIDLPIKATLANNFTAILATQGSTLITGQNIIINNWYYGIAARDGSYVYCPNVRVSNAGDVGIWAFCGSTIVANGATSDFASDTANNYGFGFQAEFGSTLVATNAKATGCYKAGFAALSNSTLRVHNCESYANVGSGFLSWAGGQIEAWGSSSHDNQRYGLEIAEYGNIIGITTNTNNALGKANSFAYFDVSTGQARVASSRGPLRIDTVGTSGIYFHNGEGLQFSIGNSTAPTSRLEVRGGGVDTGDQPMLNAVGTAADISIRYDAKGDGNHYFNNGNGLMFAIKATESIANRLEVVGTKTGESPHIKAVGSDPIIDLALYPKGNGSYIKLGAGYFTTTDAPIVGYISIKDNNGVVRKLAVIA